MSSTIDLETYGVAWSKAFYMNVSATLVSSGIQLFMCLYGLSIFLETPLELRRGRAPYLVVSFVIFILFALSGYLDTYHAHEVLFKATSGQDFIGQYMGTRDTWYRYTSTFCMIGFVAASDGLLLLRCYIIWKDRSWVCIVPTIAYLTSNALGIYAFSASRSTNKFATAWTFTTVAVNVLATGIIAFRLIQANRSLRVAMPNRNVKVFTDVITMLVESAVPPTIFGIVLAAVNNISSGKTTETVIARTTASYTFSLLYFSFVALSPQMIIFRVTTGRSWVKKPGQDTKSGPPMTNPLVFAQSHTFDQSFFISDGAGLNERGMDRERQLSSSSDGEKKSHSGSNV